MTFMISTEQSLTSDRFKPLHWLQHIGYVRLVLSGLLLAGVGYLLLHYPLKPLWLAGFLIAYAGITLRYPNSWLFFLPALLPIMDFTPWTGRFFFDEFDVFLLTTIALQLWHKPAQAPIYALFNQTTLILFGLFMLFYCISLLLGLLPLAPIDNNAFSNYYSNYNSLRVGKGVLWGALLLPFLNQALQNNAQTKLYLAYGILTGLTAVIIVAIIERTLFVSLFDFSTHYRINALFSTMHTGGGHIESYLMLSLPFIGVLFCHSRATTHSKVFGIILFVSGVYVLLVTFSRGGYIGFAVGFISFIASVMLRSRHIQWRKPKQLISVLLLVLLVPLMAVPVFQGQLIQQRFNIFAKDKDIRTNHWLDAINMMDDSVMTHLLGMGIGSYPRTYFWLNNENVIPATYKIEKDIDNEYLRLRGGDDLYMGQYLNLAPKTQYHLHLDVRSAIENGTLNVALCEKSLIYSLRCSSASLAIKDATPDTWQSIDYVLDTGEVGEKSANIAVGLLARPVQLSIHNGNGAGKVLDIDNIKLIASDDSNQVANGDFTYGLDRWFFGTEKHHPWHILNLWVHILFDQGFIGLALFILLLFSCLQNIYKKLVYDLFSTIFLSSLLAFIVVGWVDSPFDAPRITVLFFLIMVCALANSSSSENFVLQDAHTR